MTGGPPSAGDRTAGSAVDPLAASGGRCRAPNRQPGPTRASASTAIFLVYISIKLYIFPFWEVWSLACPVSLLRFAPHLIPYSHN